MVEFSHKEQTRAFELYGRAIGSAQHLETSVVELVAMGTVAGAAANEDRWIFTVREFLKLPTETIFDSFIRHFGVPPDLANRLKEAIGLRDTLVRRYLWEKEEKVFTAEGNREIQAECQRLWDHFHALSEEVYSHAQERMPALKQADELISKRRHP